MENNRLIRGITKDKNIRFFVIDAPEVLQRADEYFNLSLTNKIIMGRLLNAALIMGADLKKDDDLISLILECDGPIGGAVATANRVGQVKGYLHNPEVETGVREDAWKFDIPKALGKGVIKIIRNIGLKKPYQGQVELRYGTIARDLTYYYATSEQILSSMGLGVLLGDDGKIKQSSGFLVQLMPDSDEEIAVKLEHNISSFPSMNDILEMGFSIEDVLKNFILKEIDFKILEIRKVKYYCDCSKAKFARGLKLMGEEQVKKILQEDGKLEINCHFCNKDYIYNTEDIRNIFRSK